MFRLLYTYLLLYSQGYTSFVLLSSQQHKSSMSAKVLLKGNKTKAHAIWQYIAR